MKKKNNIIQHNWVELFSPYDIYHVTNVCILCLVLFLISEMIPKCGVPDSPLNGTAGGTTTTVGSTWRFQCDEGLNLIGSSERQCLENLTWSGEETECIGDQN